MSLLQRLLDPQHLFDLNPGPPTGLYFYGLLLLGLALLGATGAAFALERRRHSAWLLAEAGLCAAGAALVAARVLGVPVLSMRALLLANLALVAVPPAAVLLREAGRRGWLSAQLRLLALCPSTEDAVLPWPLILTLLAVHLAGLTLVYRFLDQPYILALRLAVISLAVLFTPLVLSVLFRHHSGPRAPHHLSRSTLTALRSTLSAFALTLTPLALLYVIVIAYRVVFVLLNVVLPTVQAFALPDLGMAFFNLEANVWAALGYVLLMEVTVILKAWGRQRWLVSGAAVALLIGTALWTTVDYTTHVAAGVTAGDPYGYAQMAVDIARQGHPIHAFHLPTLVTSLPVDPEPTTPIGYSLIDSAGHAISSWPFGGAMPIALGYLLLGERGLYLATPAVGMLCLLAAAALAWEVTRGWSRGYRLLAVAAAVFLVGTSYEQIDRLLVPMGDASAQLATTLFFLFVLRGGRTGRLRDAVLAGAALGAAYLVRHTQVALLPVAAALAWGTLAKGKFATFARLGIAGLVAFAVAMPDLLYHWVAFGSPLHAEQSGELAAFSVSNIPGSLGFLAAAFLSQHEFGYVLPFTLAGVWAMARERRRALVVVLAGAGLLVAVQAPYYFVKPRDLLPALPVAAVLTGYGLSAACLRLRINSQADSQSRLKPTGHALRESQTPDELRKAENICVHLRSSASHSWGLLLRAGLVALVLFTFSARTWLLKPLRPHWAGYGGLTTSERAAFDELGTLTPADAAIGSSLNGGPIVLYSGRMTYRPGSWTEAELGAFCQDMFDRGVPVYLLHDGSETHDALRYAQAHYRVTAVAWLDVPLFGERDQATGVLYRLEPPVGAMHPP